MTVLKGTAILLFFRKREDFRVVDYQPISALINQIPLDAWDVLQQIKERRPAMMLSELIAYRARSPERSQPLGQRYPIAEPAGNESRHHGVGFVRVDQHRPGKASVPGALPGAAARRPASRRAARRGAAF